MAKFEKEIDANFDDILEKIEQGMLKGNISANLEDLEGEDCAMLTPTREGMTHCCLFEIGDEIYCGEVSDDQYENMGRFIKYTVDKNTNTDVDIDCSSKFLSLSLFVIFALLF